MHFKYYCILSLVILRLIYCLFVKKKILILILISTLPLGNYYNRVNIFNKAQSVLVQYFLNTHDKYPCIKDECSRYCRRIPTRNQLIEP